VPFKKEPCPALAILSIWGGCYESAVPQSHTAIEIPRAGATSPAVPQSCVAAIGIPGVGARTPQGLLALVLLGYTRAISTSANAGVLKVIAAKGHWH
jgi:hypothetical protein